MSSYTIYEKPGLPVPQVVDSAVLVKNHYSMLAFFLPIVWILVNRLWWVLAGYIIIMVPVVALESILPVWSSMLLTLLLSLWICLEAPNLIGWSLQRKGYVEVASLYAEDKEHCERRYIDARLAASQTANNRPEKPKSDLQTNPLAQKEKLRQSSGAASVIGLFPVPQAPEETK